MREELPEAVTHRAKHGFDVPVDRWLRGPLRDDVEAILLAPGARVAALLNQAAVRTLYRSHLAHTGRHGRVLWNLLVLAHWAERYLA
jgi:asparagine synthase (glutamine-hydrolysing)